MLAASLMLLVAIPLLDLAAWAWVWSAYGPLSSRPLVWRLWRLIFKE